MFINNLKYEYAMTKEMIEPTEQQIKSIINLRYSEWEEQEDSCFDDDEKNSLWQLFYNECKEIAKQQLNEDIFEIDYEQIKENYNEKYFEQKEIKEITQQATEEKIKSLKFDFISHCSNFSYMNELAIEAIFHSVFSALLKHIPIIINNKKILTKLHINWQQDSGSGKGELLKEINRILELFNRLFEKEYKIKSMDGSETIESYYNRFKHTNNKQGMYDTNVQIIGTFQEADIIEMEECSYIFVEKRGQKQTKSEILLKALEDQSMLKTLASWNGKETITIPNFVLISTTRLIPEIQETIATSGLLQRTIPVFRNIDPETRMKMNLKNIYKRVKQEDTDDNYQKNRELICYQFRKLILFVEKHHNFIFENEEDCYQLLSQQYDIMEKYLYNTLTRTEHQKIAEAFIARFIDKIIVLAIQNAALRETEKVSTTDIKNACELIQKLYIGLCLWIEQSIDENRLLKSRRKVFINYCNKWFKLQLSYEKEEFVQLLMKATQFSRNYALYLIDSYSHGEKAILKIEDDKIYKNNTRVENG